MSSFFFFKFIFELKYDIKVQFFEILNFYSYIKLE